MLELEEILPHKRGMAATDGGRLSKEGGRVATYDVLLATDVFLDDNSAAVDKGQPAGK